MALAKEMLDAQERLQKLGHEVDVPCDTDLHVQDPELRNDFERDAKHVKENNIMRRCFELVAQSDAVLVLNHRHNDVDGYVGASALMEVGIATYLDKKLFILYPPTERYRHELSVLGGIVIDGEFSKIPV